MRRMSLGGALWGLITLIVADGRGSGSPGTGGRKPPPNRGQGGGKAAVCGEKCQLSPKPKSTCRCRAGKDCKHGSKAGAAAGSGGGGSGGKAKP
jgi:hypothetical protein